jgi:hypothetical protein
MRADDTCVRVPKSASLLGVCVRRDEPAPHMHARVFSFVHAAKRGAGRLCLLPVGAFTSVQQQ